MTLIFSAFGAGLLSSLSPCIFPVIPITVGFLGIQAGEKKSAKHRVISFFVGQVIAFTALGLAAVKFGEVFGFTSQASGFQTAIGIFLIIFGFLSFFTFSPTFFAKCNQKHQTLGNGGSTIGALIVGISTALMASPCSSPILGSVLISLSETGSYRTGFLAMLAYAIGASSLFLALGLGLSRLPKRGNWMKKVHKGSSLLMIAVGIYYICLSLK
jgi:cytochrome c biogenesis protein CcdA